MRKFDSINVIPFIDIMLVLLAIVLTTATFVANGRLDIDLPVAGAESSVDDVDVIEIGIDRDEKFYLDGEVKTLEQIRRELQGKPPHTPVTLLIDEAVAFRRFVTLIDLLKEMSLEKISILTRKNS